LPKIRHLTNLPPMKFRLVLIVLLVVALAGGAFLFSRNSSHGASGQAALEYTKEILACGPRPAGSKELGQVRELVTSKLNAAGWIVTEEPFERDTPIGKIKFVNLRARFPTGSGDPWKQPIEGLLCAHLDSKYFKDQVFVGADDSASACGAIIEISQVLAKSKPEQAKMLELVFFDGEEAFVEFTTLDGLYGSRQYTANWRNRSDKPRFGILLDMIGHQNLRIALPSDSASDLKNHLMAAAEAEKAAGHFEMAAEPITDDHVPLNQVGIPTLDVIGDFQQFNWWHHRRGGKDELDNLSAESLDISMRVTLRTLDRLLGKDTTAK
jgi:glutaminyl-peptide cyclotransferase